MSNERPWSKPANSAIPNRPGDLEEQPIYTALGRAVSNWEGVNAAMAVLFRVLIEEEDRPELDANAIEAFGSINNVHKRAKQIKDQWESFFDADFGRKKDEVHSFRQELAQLMAAYRGWAERRNDLAHGYVTRADGPDYEQEDQPIIATFALCPSHARFPKWLHGEPEYNYVASEIIDFASAFRALDEQTEAVAERIEDFRVWRISR